MNVRRLGSLLGSHVSVAASPITARAEDLLPAEAAVIAKAVAKRRNEFATGRLLARSLLADFGYQGPLIPREDRTPCWPEGVIGSITHSACLCVVAVAPLTLIASIGIDVEPATELAKELWPTILTARETAWIGREPASRQGLIAKAVFCAKEAVYKCQYTLSGRFLEFHDVEITPVGQQVHFAGDFVASIDRLAAGLKLDGFVTVFARHFLAGVVLQQRDIPVGLPREFITTGASDA